VADLTGPIPEGVTSELEALKAMLAAMAGDDLSEQQTAAMAQEIGAIRLQLKRLALEQADSLERLERRPPDY
jgi:hypothetical protein